MKLAIGHTKLHDLVIKKKILHHVLYSLGSKPIHLQKVRKHSDTADHQESPAARNNITNISKHIYLLKPGDHCMYRQVH
jgi:hypothetical protein